MILADNITLYPPPDPHLRRWMSFVDGENFTIRAQKLAESRAIPLVEGEFYQRDVFVWIPKFEAHWRRAAVTSH